MTDKKIEQIQRKQEERERMEFEALMQAKWRLQPYQEKIAAELLAFLAEKLPKIELPSYRLRLYWIDKQLQREFEERLRAKGLL
ncbi:hypothetical protein KEJ45_04855 [Candidatus Bathyarchaeota archaeon]|nr:hypothetical protein [Candidatus Bathyarchaeota archaeon]